MTAVVRGMTRRECAAVLCLAMASSEWLTACAPVVSLDSRAVGHGERLTVGNSRHGIARYGIARHGIARHCTALYDDVGCCGADASRNPLGGKSCDIVCCSPRVMLYVWCMLSVPQSPRGGSRARPAVCAARGSSSRAESMSAAGDHVAYCLPDAMCGVVFGRQAAMQQVFVRTQQQHATLACGARARPA